MARTFAKQIDVIASPAPIAIIAGTTVDDIVAVAAMERVVVRAAVERVIASHALNDIETGAAVETVGAVVAPQLVVAGGGNGGQLGELGGIPHAAVLEDDLFDPCRLVRTIHEIVGLRDRVAAVLERQHQVAPAARRRDIGRRDGGAEAQHIVGRLHAGLFFADDVASITLGEQIGIVADAAVQAIVSAAAVERVVAKLAIQLVGASASGDAVGAVGTMEFIGTGRGDARVGGHGGLIPRAAVGKAQLLDPIVDKRWRAGELPSDIELLAGGHHGQAQLVALARGLDVGLADTGAKLHRIDIACVGIAFVKKCHRARNPCRNNRCRRPRRLRAHRRRRHRRGYHCRIRRTGRRCHPRR